ncbi:MAG: Zn-ribbon domain-containing OB-fold protein [Thermoplasmata archaeon]|nr:Zn-ribbon domain-containing OB-fold protein [Thermoplasmata archaeon]
MMPRFWREIPSRYSLMGSRCGNCGKIWFPTRDMCPDCHRKSLGKMEPYRLKPEGTIVTYTVIHTAQKGFEAMAPYVMAVVELDDGVRVTSQVIDCEPEDVAIGKRVKAVLRRISEEGKEGTINYGYKFVLADQPY